MINSIFKKEVNEFTVNILKFAPTEPIRNLSAIIST